MSKTAFMKSAANMTEAEKREFLVELQQMERWLSEDRLGKSEIEGAGVAGESDTAMLSVK
jgi:hypothetical protein